MEELEQMLSYARRSTQEWNDFLDSFVDDEELIARIKAKSPRLRCNPPLCGQN